MNPARQIFLDTETTGLEPKLGHRIVEVAAVEMVGRRLTKDRRHFYLNPERESDAAALNIHGLDSDFLRDKPKFAEVAADLMGFIEGAEVLIHNAPFDQGFLNHELGMAGLPPLESFCQITDTLKMAKERHPGKRNNLDALCERYQVNNAKRTLHGALLDAELLAEIYLAMTRGQDSLMMDLEHAAPSALDAALAANLEWVVVRATDEELAQHAAQLESIDKASKGKCLWKQL